MVTRSPFASRNALISSASAVACSLHVLHQAVVNIATGVAAKVLNAHQLASSPVLVRAGCCWLTNSAELSASEQLARKLLFRADRSKSRTHHAL